MAFDFPATPDVGTIFNIAGISYVWDGVAWNLQPAAAPSGKTALALNFFVNPAMQVSQENGDTEAASVQGYYMADQWYGAIISTGTLLGARAALRTPRGSVYRIRARVGTADTSLAATEYALPFFQPFEGTNVAFFGWGTPYAIPVVVRFGFRGPAGTYTAVLRDPSGSVSFVHPFTVAPADANLDIEVTFPVPAPAIGTWPTDISRSLTFGIFVAVGSALFSPTPDAWVAGNLYGVAGMSNGMAVSGNYFYLSDAGLYADPDKTGVPPPWQMPDYGDELGRCKRYWQRIMNMFSGNVTTGNTYYGHGYWDTEPRTTPTLTGAVAGQAAFPATVGSLSVMVGGMYESRISNATGTGIFDSVITANARV